MPSEPPPEVRQLLASQGHVITRTQAIAQGMNAEAIRNRARYCDWQRLMAGVYADFTGEPKREALIWAALLRAGPGAALSHWTAAERHGLLDRPSATIHLTVHAAHHPARRAPIPGVVVHRSRLHEQAVHPVMSPPCTRVEHTVLDLIEASASFEEAYAWICRAIGRRRTTAARLSEAMAMRSRMRWRQDLELALGDAAVVLSVLERRYLRGVERPHGLPVATRQARVWQGTGNRYLDNRYAEYRACVEIDGAAAHPADEQWRDKDRDRWNAVHEGIDTIRIGMLGLMTPAAQCATAAEWTGCGDMRRRWPTVFSGGALGLAGSGWVGVVEVAEVWRAAAGGVVEVAGVCGRCRVGWLRGAGVSRAGAGGHGVKVGLGWCGWRGLGWVAEVGALAWPARGFPLGLRWSSRQEVRWSPRQEGRWSPRQEVQSSSRQEVRWSPRQEECARGEMGWVGPALTN